MATLSIHEFIDLTRITSPYVRAENTVVGGFPILMGQEIPGLDFSFRPIFSLSRRTETVQVGDQFFLLWDDGFNHALCSVLEICLAATSPEIEVQDLVPAMIERLYRILYAEAAVSLNEPGAMSVFARFLQRGDHPLAAVKPFSDNFFNYGRISDVLEAAQIFTFLHELGHVHHRTADFARDIGDDFGNTLASCLEHLQEIYGDDRLHLVETASDLMDLGEFLDGANPLNEEIRALAGDILGNDSAREEFICDLVAIYRMGAIRRREGIFALEEFYPMSKEMSANACVMGANLAFSVLSLLDRVFDSLRFRRDPEVLARRLHRRRAVQVLRRDITHLVLGQAVGWSDDEIELAFQGANELMDAWQGLGMQEEQRIQRDVFPEVEKLSARFAAAPDGREWTASLRDQVLELLGYRGTADEVARFRHDVRRWRTPKFEVVTELDMPADEEQSPAPALPVWLEELGQPVQDLFAAELADKRAIVAANAGLLLDPWFELRLRALAEGVASPADKDALLWHAGMVATCRTSGIDTAFDNFDDQIKWRALEARVRRFTEEPDWADLRRTVASDPSLLSEDVQVAIAGAIEELQRHIDQESDLSPDLVSDFEAMISNLRAHGDCLRDCQSDGITAAFDGLATEPADGLPRPNRVTVEVLKGDRWETVRSFEPD